MKRDLALLTCVYVVCMAVGLGKGVWDGPANLLAGSYSLPVNVTGVVLGLGRTRRLTLRSEPGELWWATGLTAAFAGWGLGDFLWLFWDYHPSLADVSYALGSMFLLVGLTGLFRAISNDVLREIQPLFTPAIFLAGAPGVLTYQLRKERAGEAFDVVKYVMDMYYPVMDVILLVVLLGLLLGVAYRALPRGLGRCVLLALAAGLVNYVGDLGLVVTTSLPAGNPAAFQQGGWVDMAYATAIYLLGVALLMAPAPELPVHQPAEAAQVVLHT